MNRFSSMALALVVTLCFAGTAVASSRHFSGPRFDQRSVQFRLGLFQPDGESDFWDATSDTFTLSPSDFDDVTVGFSYVRGVAEQMEVGFNVDFYERRERSDYRDFVDIDGFPILHDTELAIVPLTVDFRFVPGGRYRERPGGRRLPKPLFYVGAGAGLTFWDYEEIGDFLDFTFDPPEIFFDRFHDDGVALELHLLAGVEVPISRRTNFLAEARLTHSDDELGGDFAGLPEREIDLGGSSIFGGVSFAF